MTKILTQHFQILVIFCVFQIPFLDICNALGNFDFSWQNSNQEGHLSQIFENLDEGSSGSSRIPRSLPHHFKALEMYDKESPPPKVNGTGVPVKFTVLIYSVRGVNEIEQELTIEMRLQIWWLDSRLDAWKSHVPKKYISITKDVDAKLWHPDICIDFVKEIIQPKLLGTTAVSTRYYKNGFIRTSARLTIRMACPMAFHYYPVDQQECHIDMKSYAYTNDILALQWDEGKNNLVLMKPGLDLPNFALALDFPRSSSLRTGSGNYYSSVAFTVLLRRKLAYHFIQTYLPSFVFVVISWLSFLVPPESVPGRMAICMTTLLSLATMFGGIRQSVPKVSYPKALDIWMVACIFFAFLALVEYALVLKMRALVPKEQERQVRKASLAPPSFLETTHEAKMAGTNSEVTQPPPVPYNKYAYLVRMAESYTWLLVIIMFGIFNLIYWPWLLTSSGYYSKFGEDLFYNKDDVSN